MRRLPQPENEIGLQNQEATEIGIATPEVTFSHAIVLDRPAISLEYSKRYKMMWNYGKGKFPSVLEDLKANTEDYFWFSPVSVPGENVNQLLRN